MSRFEGIEDFVTHPEGPCENSECKLCCEHFEYDHGHCLDCGKDCTEDLAGRGEDYYEGDR